MDCDHYIIDIEATEVKNNICLEFDDPGIIRVVAETIIIEELPVIKTIFEPRVSERQIHVTADLDEIPNHNTGNSSWDFTDTRYLLDIMPEKKKKQRKYLIPITRAITYNIRKESTLRKKVSFFST
jgi:hypothetical protein